MSSITLKSDVLRGERYFQLKCTQKSNGSVENSSTITWELSAIGDTYYYDTGPTTVVINGTTVYSRARTGWEYGQFPVAQGSTSGTIVIPHNNDGTKKITVKFSTAVYYSTVHEYSDTWTLTNIPRYATSVQSLNSKTETSIKMNWSSDSTIDYLWYSDDNGGSWKGVNVTDGKSGTYTISGLIADTEYKIKTRVRRKDSQLTTDSAVLSVRTHDYPHCTSAPNFILGDNVRLSFYNPLGRTFTYYIIGNGTEIGWKTCSIDYDDELSLATFVNPLYNTIPNAQLGVYQVRVVYGESVRTLDSGSIYVINEANCRPTFTSFSYKDVDALTTSVTGNNQVIVKGQSSIQVYIPASRQMVTKNGAYPDKYVVTIGNVQKECAYSATAETKVVLGTVSTTEGVVISVRAYDTRGVSYEVVQPLTVVDYEKPVINAQGVRLNGFENETTLSVSGKYWGINVGGADTNKIQNVQYRYRETNGEWTRWWDISTTLTNGEYKCSDVYLSLDNSKSHEVEVSAHDKMTGNTVTVYVDVGQPTFFMCSNLKRFYIDSKPALVGANEDNYLPVSSYPVEDGTSGIWSYTKWNNKNAELWGVATLDTVASTVYMYAVEALPFALESPVVSLTVVDAGSSVVTQGGIVLSYAFNEGQIVVALIKEAGGITEGTKVKVSVSIKCKWK